jgi:hypothetical protein
VDGMMPREYGKIESVPQRQIVRQSPCDEYPDTTRSGWS